MNNPSGSPGLPDDRVIRVFVSSTFRDMQGERDELVLRVFPQLRRLCEARGVTWGEVDLRWGIPEEQAERGVVLPICLEEITRCRPYFIGLLGERYGWVPDTIPAEVVEREPWVQAYADGHGKTSVTELEILQGVLNNPAMADHAFFYFRDPEFVESIPADKRPDFAAEDTESQTKLAHLKDRIRQAHQEGTLHYAPREDYPDAKDLGAQVLADFTALIDTLYPEGEQPSPVERVRRDHEAFAQSRARVYIGRQAYMDRLEEHVALTDPPLVVLGESGGGKSALLANWALRYRQQHPDEDGPYRGVVVGRDRGLPAVDIRALDQDRHAEQHHRTHHADAQVAVGLDRGGVRHSCQSSVSRMTASNSSNVIDDLTEWISWASLPTKLLKGASGSSAALTMASATSWGSGAGPSPDSTPCDSRNRAARSK